jgi:hypothetical protein
VGKENVRRILAHEAARTQFMPISSVKGTP